VGISGLEGKVGGESESWSLGELASSMPLSGSQDSRVVSEEGGDCGGLELGSLGEGKYVPVTRSQ